MGDLSALDIYRGGLIVGAFVGLFIYLFEVQGCTPREAVALALGLAGAVLVWPVALTAYVVGALATNRWDWTS